MRVNLTNAWPPDAAYAAQCTPAEAPADVAPVAAAPAADVQAELPADDGDWTIVHHVGDLYDKWVTLVRRPGAPAHA